MPCSYSAIPPFVPVLQTWTLLKILILGLRPRLLMARAFGAHPLAGRCSIFGDAFSVLLFLGFLLSREDCSRSSSQNSGSPPEAGRPANAVTPTRRYAGTAIPSWLRLCCTAYSLLSFLTLHFPPTFPGTVQRRG